MKIKVYCKNQLELASELNILIDEYWNNNIVEDKLVIELEKICEANKEKLFKDGQYTMIIQQRCGKKRLDLLEKIIKR